MARIFLSLSLVVCIFTIACAAEKSNVPDGYALVYQQDFADEDSLGDFRFASPDDFRRVKVGDRWALEYGNKNRKSSYKPPHRSPYYIALLNNRKLGSFVLEYDVQQRSVTGNHRDHCVFFNFVDPANFYYTHIAKASDPNSHQIMIVDDAPRTPITKKGTKGHDWAEMDKWHHVRIERDSDTGTIAIYVNDMTKPIMTATSKVHGPGFVGFGSFDDLGRVSNIKLWSKDTTQADCAFFKAK